MLGGVGAAGRDARGYPISRKPLCGVILERRLYCFHLKSEFDWQRVLF